MLRASDTGFPERIGARSGRSILTSSLTHRTDTTMTKRIVTALIASAFLIAAPLSAQVQDDPRMGGLVVKGGMSFGGVSNSGVFPGSKSRNGFAIGLGLVTSAPLGLGIEGLYAQRGITGDAGGGRELDYIDIPVYLRLGLTNPTAEPYFLAGPQISLELKCDDNGDDCPSGRDNVSYSAVIGAGLRFPQAAGISVEARYVYGLSDLKLSTVSDSDSYQTRSFLVLFALGF